MNIRLSKNFTLDELTYSNTANKYKIDNSPSDEIKSQLKKLANDILQPIREAYGHSIKVTSGYRCKALNTKVGGAKTSQHMLGQAADIKATVGTNKSLFDLIKKMMSNKQIKVGQLIWEYGTKTEPNWIHISLPYKKVNNILYLYSK